MSWALGTFRLAEHQCYIQCTLSTHLIGKKNFRLLGVHYRERLQMHYHYTMSDDQASN